MKIIFKNSHPIRFEYFVLIALSLNFFSACKTTATSKNDLPEDISARKSKNEAVLQKAKDNIEKYRKGDVQIKVLDAQGKPVRGAKLNIKQVSHDFKFGCYLKIDDLAPEKLSEYEKHFARLFNYAVVGTFWDFVENKRGKENWLWFERETALSQKLGARIQAAPILWGTNEFGTPGWLPRRKNELLPILEYRVRSTVTKYQNVVEDWEIVNEPLAPKKDFFAQTAGDEYIESAFLQARQAAPGERLLINEYGVFGSIATDILIC
jgi:GH35 family endo-1,4-beta-xylanase